MTKTELWRLCINTIAPEDFDKALKAGRDANMIKTETKDGLLYYKGVKQ